MVRFARLMVIGFFAVLASSCTADEVLIEGQEEVQQQPSTTKTTTTEAPQQRGTVTTESSDSQTDTEPPCIPTTDGTRVVADPENWVGYLEDCSTRDPLWLASVSLACGSTPDLRVVESFTADTNNRGTETQLYSSESSGNIWPLEVGAEFPAERRLAWQIPGFLLGPWEVEEVIDHCDESSTTQSS